MDKVLCKLRQRFFYAIKYMYIFFIHNFGAMRKISIKTSLFIYKKNVFGILKILLLIMNKIKSGWHI